MNWLNIHTSTLRSAAFIGSTPVERATWLCVLAHCVEQENGGRITAARKMKCRHWQQLCGTTAKEIVKTTRLFKWDGDDLIVIGYPLSKEVEVQEKREFGRLGGVKSSQAQGQAKPKHQPPLQPPLKPPLQPPLVGERKEKEKGKEKDKEKDKGKENRREGEIAAPGKPGRSQRDDVSTDEMFMAEIRRHYQGIDIDTEISKMRAWLLTPKGIGKNITRGRVVNWLNRCDRPLVVAAGVNGKYDASW